MIFYFSAAAFIIYRLDFQDNDYMSTYHRCVALYFVYLLLVLYLPQYFL